MTRVLVAAQRPWGLRAYEQLREWRRDAIEWSHCYTEHAGADALLGAAVGTFRPRFVLCFNWSSIVPQEILDASECVNFHCAPLPFGRGGHPIENMILRGYDKTVVTAHRMVAELDAGPIYGVSAAVPLRGSKAEILDRLVDPCVRLSELILAQWLDGGDVTAWPQDERAAVRFHRLSVERYERFWSERAR